MSIETALSQGVSDVNQAIGNIGDALKQWFTNPAETTIDVLTPANETVSKVGAGISGNAVIGLLKTTWPILLTVVIVLIFWKWVK